LGTTGGRVVLVIIIWRRPVGPVVLLIAERRLSRPIILMRRRPVVWLRRRDIVPVSDTDRRPVVEPGSGTGFVSEPSRRRRDH
jgi:hypothetical protein